MAFAMMFSVMADKDKMYGCVVDGRQMEIA